MNKNALTSPLGAEEPARSLSDAIAVVDAEGIVRWATPTVAAYYGYPLEAIIGGRALEFIAPESHEYVRERWNALLAHPERMTDTFSLSMQTAEGRRIPIRTSVWRLPGRDEFLLLHHVIERVRDRLDTVYAIQAAVSSMLDVEKLMETVLNEVRRLIPCSSCAIFFLERDKTVQVRRWRNEAVERRRSLIRERPPELETSRFLRETNQPLIINDTLTDPRWRVLPSHRPIRSWLGAPLVHHGHFLGELNLDSPDPNQFSQEDAELAHALATQIAAALHNARQYQDEQRHAERLRVLNEISLAISQLELTSVLEMIYQNIARLMDASTFFIGLLGAEAQVVHIVGSYDFGQRRPDEFQGTDEGITGLVLRTRRPLILHDTETEPLPPEIIIQGEMPRSVLMMPLLVQDEIVGVISVQSYEPNSYTQNDIDLLETIAGTIAVAVRNAQLYDQTAERADELARANARLQAQDALRKELVYQVSHDLRSPLQIVYGYAGMMHDGDIGPVTDYQQEVLGQIIRRSKAIERMTQDIMAAKPISRETLELGPVDVSELCAQAVASAQVVHRSQSHLTFRAEIASEHVLVEGDYNRLTRALDNLIGNAVKFSPQGGEVVVCLTCDAARNCAVVSVSDKGIGIPADQIPFLFERFFRAHRGRFDGSGLGLYNVQQIVHAHNGQVWAESAEGQGSTFSFSLPLAGETSAAT